MRFFLKKTVWIPTVAVLAAAAIAISAFLIFSPSDGGGETPAAAASGSTTLMVYMLGSDLEGKAGAGTDDLEEMLASGVDAANVNVLVYTGGAKKWYNDYTDSTKNHVLKLTASGFETVTSFESSSMGEAPALSEFLNYSYENYPADRFALVMWDHGNGPIIGYGKDMLYSNDSLTLREMKTALDASPFKADNKLDWVGFDACLMSSAELACIWSEHADYLVASQEIEPAFGWNYSFLSEVSSDDTPALLGKITDNYLNSCLAYFESKKYTDRDTTLAVMNLSLTDELSSAIDALFAKAKGDVDVSYNALTTRRVQTRALGRASTGSEYDLIDLNDMAAQLSDLYPTETAALQKVISQMVLNNATNTTGCCGMSLYYPFYNKEYYTDSWSDTYTELGLFPEYREYLGLYGDVWLRSDKLASVTQNIVPVRQNKTSYTMQLTSEQADNYAQSRYYIVRKVTEGQYTRIFSSQSVTKSTSGLLTAAFDGTVIYAKNKTLNEYFLPVVRENDKVGDITRYTAYANLSTLPITYMFDDYLETLEQKTLSSRFNIAVNTTTKSIAVSALLPNDYDVDATALINGKAEEIDIDEWNYYHMLNERYLLLTRNENGIVNPISEWDPTSVYTMNVVPVGDGLEFVYAPLVGDNYYLLFEVEDTQGNRFCSELLPIESGEWYEAETPPPAPIETKWESGKEIKVLDKENVEIYLTTVDYYGTTRYAFRYVNNNDHYVQVSLSELLCNDGLYCHDALLGLENLAPGENFLDESGLSLGDAASVVSKLTAMRFIVDLTHGVKGYSILHNQEVIVELGDNVSVPIQGSLLSGIPTVTDPFMGAFASEQTLLEKDGIKLTLQTLGAANSNSYLNVSFKVENTADSERTVSIDGISLGGIFVPTTTSLTLPGKSYSYFDVSLFDDDFEERGIVSIPDAKLAVRINSNSWSNWFGQGAVTWHTIRLDSAGSKASQFAEGKTVLYNEHGIRIALIGENKESDDILDWKLSFVNNSGQDVRFTITDIVIDGVAYKDPDDCSLYPVDEQVGNGQRTISWVVLYDNTAAKSVSFRFKILSFSEDVVLYEAQNAVTLSN